MSITLIRESCVLVTPHVMENRLIKLLLLLLLLLLSLLLLLLLLLLLWRIYSHNSHRCLNIFSILVCHENIFQHSEKAVNVSIKKKLTVFPFAITHQFLFQITFRKFLNLLYTITCHIISNMSWIRLCFFQKPNLQELIRDPNLNAFRLLLVLNVKLILFVLALVVPLTLSRVRFLLHKICAHGLPDIYINWFRSYLSNL